MVCTFEQSFAHVLNLLVRVLSATAENDTVLSKFVSNVSVAAMNFSVKREPDTQSIQSVLSLPFSLIFQKTVMQGHNAVSTI